MSPEAGDTFVGREPELTILRAAAARAREGRPQVALVVGDPGIGKTALVERFLREVPDADAVWAVGEETEAAVPDALLDHLVRAMGGDGLLADDRGGGTIEAGLGLVERLDELQDGATLVVVVVDDAQWSDPTSLEALLFAARRLHGHRVLVVVVERSGGASTVPAGLRRLASGSSGLTVRLRPLVVEVVMALARGSGLSLTAPAAQRILEHAAGNPLYTRALFEELPAEALTDGTRPLPAPSSYADLIAARLGGLRPRARALVAAAAVLGMRTTLAAAATLSESDEPLEALEDARAGGLLEVLPTQEPLAVRFPQPLLRAAVLEALGPAERAALHRRAAGLADDPAVALRHRAAAAVTPDDELAGELERFAEADLRRGAATEAAEFLVAASRLSEGHAARERRLLEAVQAMLSGDVGRARTHAESVAAAAPGPLRDAVLGHLAMVGSQRAEAERLLAAAWEGCGGDRGPLAAQVAGLNALHFLLRQDGAAALEWSDRLAALEARRGPGEAATLRAHALGHVGRTREGLAVLEPFLAADDRVTEPVLRTTRGILRAMEDDLTGAQADFAEDAGIARRLGWTGFVVFALGNLSRVEFDLGAWDDALVHGQQALALLTGEEPTYHAAPAACGPVAVAAARGEPADAYLRVGPLGPGAYESSLLAGAVSRARVAAAAWDHLEVLEALRPVLELRRRSGVDEPAHWPWQHLHGHALVSTAQLERADAFLRPHEALAAERGRRTPVARLAAVRGRLEFARGDLDAAEAAFRSAREHLDGLQRPFELANVHFAHGQALRRAGQRRAGATELRAARSTFAQLGARPYVERCDRELEASGLTPAKRRAPEPSRLTAQEQTIARLVADGLSNKEIAAELLLSVKTVQNHLTRIYAKAGVTSRTRLAAIVHGATPPSGD